MKKLAVLFIAGVMSVTLCGAALAGPAENNGGGTPADKTASGTPAGENGGGNSAGGPGDNTAPGGGNGNGGNGGSGGGKSSSETEDIEVSLADIPDGTSIVLTGASLLDKNYDMEKLDVKVQDGLIVEVGENLSGDMTLDLTGYTLMPGMIDSHVHIAGSSSYNTALLKQFLSQGITSVREEGMLSTTDEEGFIDEINLVNIDPSYAYLVSCGKYVDVEGGYGMGPTGNMGITITNTDEAAAEIEHKAELGYTQVKIGINSDESRMTADEITAIIDTAHQNRMTVAAHVNYVKYLQELVGYGLDESAHTPDDEMPADLIDQMVEAGIAMNTSGCDDESIKIANLKNFFEAGGFITVGTDKMRGYDSSMESLIAEMQVLAKAGLTVQEVIGCTTDNNAYALDINTGLIAAGYEADLIAVSGEVNETFEALLDIDFIMNDGAIILNDFTSDLLDQVASDEAAEEAPLQHNRLSASATPMSEISAASSTGLMKL